jgi:hypothetical protein
MNASIRHLCTVGILLASFASAARAEIDASAPLIYTLNMKSETVETPWWFGLVALTVSAGYEASHAKFLAALKSNAEGGSIETLLRPFSCVGLIKPGDQCRRMVQGEKEFSDEKLIALLKNEATQSARVAQITIIFDGRFFQVPVELYDARLSDKGELVRSHELGSGYIVTYSRKQHEEDIRTGRNDAPFAGKIGSKEARIHYWLGGSSPRLMSELNRSIELEAELWTATLAPDAVGLLAGDQSERKALPRVRDIVAKDCKTLNGSFPVVKDLGDYLWLAWPTKSRSIVIESRCGSDY